MFDETKFNEWKRELDSIIASKIGGLTSDDLPDYCYADAFSNGEKAISVAKKVIKMNCEEMGIPFSKIWKGK